MLFICSLTDPPSLSLNENSFLLNCNLLAQVFLWNCSSSLVQTACESESILKWELVMERLLYEETKLQQKSSIKNESRALAASGGKPVQSSYQTIRCHFCHKPGHTKKDCRCSGFPSRYCSGLRTRTGKGRRLKELSREH